MIDRMDPLRELNAEQAEAQSNAELDSSGIRR